MIKMFLKFLIKKSFGDFFKFLGESFKTIGNTREDMWDRYWKLCSMLFVVTEIAAIIITLQYPIANYVMNKVFWATLLINVCSSMILPLIILFIIYIISSIKGYLKNVKREFNNYLQSKAAKIKAING